MNQISKSDFKSYRSPQCKAIEMDLLKCILSESGTDGQPLFGAKGEEGEEGGEW